ncbi:unnamed protein product [Urochloa humidicola]
MLRRIQPLKAHALTAYANAGEDDFNHEVPERLDKAEACGRLAKFFARGTSLKTTGGPLPFSLGNPCPEDRLAYYSRPPLPEHPRQVGVTPADPIAELYQRRVTGDAEEDVGGGSHHDWSLLSQSPTTSPPGSPCRKRLRSGKAMISESAAAAKGKAAGRTQPSGAGGPPVREGPARRQLVPCESSDSDREETACGGSSSASPMMGASAEPIPVQPIRAALPSLPISRA